MKPVQTPIIPVVQATPVMAPQQVQMYRLDAFQGSMAVIVKQEFAVLELFGVEAKNRYRVHQSDAHPDARRSDGQQLLYVREQSECAERICCGPNRELTLFAHAGYDQNSPVFIQMHKPFHLAGNFPCCRPVLHISDGANMPLGRVEDPFSCCQMDQKIFDHTNQFRYGVAGTICQLGLCCPCLGDVVFNITNQAGEPVGEIRKMFDGCGELMLHTNKFKITFPNMLTAEDRALVFSSAMLIDLQYFEVSKNNQ
jgi:hypothetical protein